MWYILKYKAYRRETCFPHDKEDSFMNFTEMLQNLTGKPLADCTDQELYLALLEIVRQKSADRVQPVTGRKLYYISAEFLI